LLVLAELPALWGNPLHTCGSPLKHGDRKQILFRVRHLRRAR